MLYVDSDPRMRRSQVEERGSHLHDICLWKISQSLKAHYNRLHIQKLHDPFAKMEQTALFLCL